MVTLPTWSVQITVTSPRHFSTQRRRRRWSCFPGSPFHHGVCVVCTLRSNYSVLINCIVRHHASSLKMIQGYCSDFEFAPEMQVVGWHYF